MPDFSYKALRSDGSVVEGSIAAKDRGDANRKLANAGVQPFQVSETGRGAPKPVKAEKAKAPKAAKKTEGAMGQLRLTSTQVIFFTEELSDLLTAGVQLEPALKMMEGRGGTGPVRQVTSR
ncbi:MAG: type II secretion system F family protein, partial [Verrucomicrobiae bacterium]|nr:type II secretion system F family protein [Verrucomicrobiae bacterium]